GDQAALDQQVRVVAQDLAVLAGARLGLVGVDHQVVRPLALLLRHEGPLQAGAEAAATAPAQARGLDLLADPLRRLLQDLAHEIVGAALLRPFQPEVVQAVEVGEDAVLVFQNADHGQRTPLLARCSLASPARITRPAPSPRWAADKVWLGSRRRAMGPGAPAARPR